MNYTNSRTEFTFRSLWSSPLLVATDVYNMTEEKRSILLNKEVLEIHSDALYVAGERLSKLENGGQVWQRSRENGDTCVVLYNSGNFNTIDVTVEFADLYQPDHTAESSVLIRDLWNQVNLGEFVTSYTTELAVHDVQMLRIQWI